LVSPGGVTMAIGLVNVKLPKAFLCVKPCVGGFNGIFKLVFGTRTNGPATVLLTAMMVQHKTPSHFNE